MFVIHQPALLRDGDFVTKATSREEHFDKEWYVSESNDVLRRSQWPRGLRRRSAAARLLGFWVRIPPGARM